jgi:hypothetical protein
VIKYETFIIKIFDQVKNDNFDQVKFDQVIIPHFSNLQFIYYIVSLDKRPVIGQWAKKICNFFCFPNTKLTQTFFVIPSGQKIQNWPKLDEKKILLQLLLSKKRKL